MFGELGLQGEARNVSEVWRPLHSVTQTKALRHSEPWPISQLRTGVSLTFSFRPNQEVDDARERSPALARTMFDIWGE